MPTKLVKSNKSPNWYIRGTIRGITVEESTGTSNREAAEEIRIKREGEILYRSIHGAKATATFLEAAVMYMESGGERRFLAKPIEHFGATKLSDVDQLAIEVAAAKIYPGRANSTINRQLFTPVSAVLKFAAKRKLCEYTPLDRPKVPEGRVRWLTIDEANRLIEMCSPHLQPLVTFLFYTGARVSEALYLDWSEVDLQNAHVSFIETKNGKARGVPLHPRVVAALGNLAHRDGAVFLTHERKPYELRDDQSGGQIKTGFKAACRRAGIKDFTPHDCRHTFATWHYQTHRDLAALQALGGWSSVRMVLRYAHVNASLFSEGINALPGEFPGSETYQRQKAKGKQKYD